MRERSRQSRRGLFAIKVAGLAIICVLIGLSARLILPIGMPNPDHYFEPVSSRVLQADEVGQMIRVRKMYDRMANTGDDFTGWNPEMQDFWKYTIAFSAYGIPSAMMIDPDSQDEYRLLFDTMIWKMKSRRVWGDFTDRGFGSDPISAQNIMYKGHLNLMYGLYQLTTGDDRYAREYTWLTERLAEELRLHHQGEYEGVTCEPNAWYVECNAIGIMSLNIYDRLYGTDYTETEVQWTLDFMMDRMRDDDTGLFYRSYHPQQDVVVKDISGYANAWTLTFLRPFLPEDMQLSYQSFTDNLVLGYGPTYASIKGDLRSNPSRNQVAHLFGLWAAKEFDDPTLFGKLRNSVDKAGHLGPAPDGGAMYADENSVLMNGVVLAAKLHVGWEEILNHDWGHERPSSIPDTSDLTWHDLLPARVYQMNDGRNPLPQSSLNDRACPNCFWGDYESIRMRAAKDAVDVCTPDSAAQNGCSIEKLDTHEFQ
ncbi:hypothetical protein [Algimonas ampicilliniresistens]|uniref:linalool dehydratase/isomerase domain-containing protein n=1 Tax=Algimonas ampicilliniresistens TaxID=1298735 RepID=UPI0024E16BB8|nr:hypothetical protein [Algimonas ampicilliniresistens]